MARPSKLTDDVQATLIKALEGGNTRASAAASAGISASTLHRWMRRGETDTTGPFRELWYAIKRAEAVCQIRCLDLIAAAAAEGRWQAAAWILERRWPESWSRRAVEQDRTEEIVVELC